MDIGIINVAEQYSSTNEASPSPFRGGGARGWVPIKGAKFFNFLLVKEQKSPE
jgi:hypothetical protein